MTIFYTYGYGFAFRARQGAAAASTGARAILSASGRSIAAANGSLLTL